MVFSGRLTGAFAMQPKRRNQLNCCAKGIPRLVSPRGREEIEALNVSCLDGLYLWWPCLDGEHVFGGSEPMLTRWTSIVRLSERLRYAEKRTAKQMNHGSLEGDGASPER